MLLRPSPLRFAGLFVAGGLVAFAGCGSSGGTAVAVTHPTMIRVEPEDFQGSVPCDPNGSGFKRYVATIVDYNYEAGGAPSTGEGGAPASAEGGTGGAMPEAELPDATGFQAPSSLPTPCSTGVGFGFVVPGRHYEVLIDGYDTDALEPRGLGSREMVATDVDPVRTPKLEPRWTAKCRNAVAVDSTLVRAGDCETFVLDDTQSGSVRFALGALLGSLACGDQPGQVDHFELVESDDSGLGDVIQTVPCSTDAQVTLTGTPNEKRKAYVEAITNNDQGQPEILAGSDCNALFKAGGTVGASCPTLSKVGTVRVDFKSVLAQLDASCGADSVTSVSVAIPGDAAQHQFVPPECLQPFDYGFPPGDHAFTLTASLVGPPATVQELTCSASALPGHLVTAECE
jgi:hypothetical protein